MNDNKKIIEMRGEKADDGEIRYTSGRIVRTSPGPLTTALYKILGIALGLAFFLLLLTFFVYVIFPVILVILLYVIVRNAFRPRRR